MKKIHKTMKWMKNVGILMLAALVCIGVEAAGVGVIHAQNIAPGTEDKSVAEALTEDVSELETAATEEILETTEASSGTWGDISWSYSNGTLTFSYEGNFHGGIYEPDSAPNSYDFEDEETRQAVAAAYPWHAYRNSVTKIVIGNGIGSVSALAFYNMPKLETVTIIDENDYLGSLGTIGDYAFAKCTSLKKIAFPDDTYYMGEGAFYNCTALEKVSGGGSMSDYAFYGCTKLKDIGTAPLGSVGAYTFAYCSSLPAVTFKGDDLVSLGDYAFAYCTGLTNVTIPVSVYEQGECVFIGCTGLEEVTIEGDETGDCTFEDCSGITKVNLPESGCYAGYGAFYNCVSLEEITGSVSGVSDYAFYNCKQLTDMAWSDSVASVGAYAYYGCTGLEEVYIPDDGRWSWVYEYAFCGCTSLKKVTFGGGIGELGDCAFMNCGLKEVWMDKTDYLSTIDVGSDVFKGNKGCKIYGLLACSGARDVAADNGCTFVPVDTLDKPVHSALTNEPTGVHVYWDAVDYALTYNVYRSSSANGTYKLIKSGLKTTNYIDVNTSFGSTYYYKVMAVGEKAKSPQSDVSKGITHVEVPGFKKIINVVSGVHVYWNAAEGAKSYNVYRSTKKGEGYSLIKKGLTATHYIDTTAVSGNTYYYKVVAVNGTSTSADTEPFKAITFVGTPDITSRFNKGAGIQLGWDMIPGATGYAIYRKPYAGNTWTRVTTIEGNQTFTWMDTSVKLNNGTVYKYTIRALAGSDMKTLSGCRNTGRTMTRLTSRTLNSATKASSTSIKCNWTTTAACDGYEVRFMIGNSVYKTFTVGNYKTGVKTFKDLKAGQRYKIQVRTYKKVDGVGTFYSAWSPEKYVTL